MFGYVIADASALTASQLARYRACYCGLCRALREQYGLASRLTLTYDMTFLTLLLSSLYEPEETCGSERCLAHPIKLHSYFETEITRYAAAMNAALAYYNCLDDWRDERKLMALAESRLLRAALADAKARYPRQCAAMEAALSRIAALEAADEPPIDALAGEFGNLMAELFVYREDRWQSALRAFGSSLGKFIYLMDAACDLEEDEKKGRFNPLSRLPEKSPAALRQLLTLLIGDASAQFERLPLVQDADILQNILYSGVWARFCEKFDPPQKEASAP